MTTPSKNELAVLAKTLQKLLTPQDPPPAPLSLEVIISWARTVSENPQKAYKQSPLFNHKVHGPMKLADVWSGYQVPTAYNDDMMDPGPMGWFCAQMAYGKLSDSEIQERAGFVYVEQAESVPGYDPQYDDEKVKNMKITLLDNPEERLIAGSLEMQLENKKVVVPLKKLFRHRGKGKELEILKKLTKTGRVAVKSGSSEYKQLRSVEKKLRMVFQENFTLIFSEGFRVVVRGGVTGLYESIFKCVVDTPKLPDNEDDFIVEVKRVVNRKDEDRWGFLADHGLKMGWLTDKGVARIYNEITIGQEMEDRIDPKDLAGDLQPCFL